MQPASIIKPLLDGILCSFHAHDEGDMEELIRRLQQQLPHDSAVDLRDWLLDDQQAVLGTRRLLHRFGQAVQWNPADDRLVLIQVTVQATRESRARVSGALHTCSPQRDG